MISSSTLELDFGEVVFGESKTETVVLKNTGSGILTIHGVHTNHPAFVVSFTDVIHLEPNKFTTLDVTFAPQRRQQYNGKIFVACNAVNSPELTIAVFGLGLGGDCDDHNECTLDAYLGDGLCENTPLHNQPCDDDNGCTTMDTCLHGLCVGQSDCDDGDPCTQDLCDLEQGCVFVVDDNLCDDGNPCTDDLCSANGCSHQNAAFGTPCGTMVGCQALPLCSQGTCTDFAVPDGTPCSDGNHCTVDDVCLDGVCGGEDAPVQPATVSWLPTFGQGDNTVMTLPDGRILFAGHSEQGVRITLARAVNNALRQEASSVFSRASHFATMKHISDNRFIAHVHGVDGISPMFGIFLLEVSPDATIQELSVWPQELDDVAPPLHMAATSHAVYWCRRNRLEIFAIDGDTLSLHQVRTLDHPCRAVSLWRKPDRVSLLITSNNAAEIYSLADPLSPRYQAPMALGSADSKYAADGDWLISTHGPTPSVVHIDTENAVRIATELQVSAVVSDFVVKNDILVVLYRGRVQPSVTIEVYPLDRGTELTAIASQHLQRFIKGITFDGVLLTAYSADDEPHVFYKIDPTAVEPLRFVSGPGHATFSTLVSHRGVVYALDDYSANIVDATNPGSLRFAAGESLVNNISLFSPLGIADGPTFTLSRARQETVLTNMMSDIWHVSLDAQGEPVVVGNWFVPPHLSLVRSNGQQIVGVRCTSSNNSSPHELRVIDMHQRRPGVDQPLTFTAQMFLPEEDNYHMVCSASRMFENLYAVALVDPYITYSSVIYVFDISHHDLGTVELVATTHVAGSVSSLALDQNRLIAVAHDLMVYEMASEPKVVVFEISTESNELVEVGATTIWGANSVLAFDETLAFIGTSLGVSIWNIVDLVPNNAVRIGYTIDLPSSPHSAIWSNDHLLLAHTDGISSVYPPCGNATGECAQGRCGTPTP